MCLNLIWPFNGEQLPSADRREENVLEQAAVPQTAGQRFVLSWKERGRFHEKELIWSILNTEHTQDFPVRERVPTERVCVGCLKSQG